MSKRPIGDYALISDCHTACLVNRAGGVDWLCFPRFDAPSIFGGLLDEAAGHWTIAPTVRSEVVRCYLDRSMVLETTFRTDGGTAVLRDAMAVGRNNRGHELGQGAPHALLREIRCTEGAVEIEIDYRPRPEYGLITPVLTRVEGGVRAQGGAQVLLLSTPVELQLTDTGAHLRLTLHEGGTLRFALQYRASWEPQLAVWSQRKIGLRFADTLSAWRSWADMHQSYDGPWRELVHSSGRVLQALTFAPTGAIVAAPTTSLPEGVGGERNWDYRFTWVRDASFTLDALWVAACPDEASRFFEFLAHAALTQIRTGGELQIMFGIGGEHDLSERELSNLSGWRNSHPVRVGNGAWRQRQLDVYGELLDAAHRLSKTVEVINPVAVGFLADLADAAAARWREKDQGIWEIRGEPRHFLYSKLMCWVALDRAVAMGQLLAAPDRVSRWAEAREEIRDAILVEGWSERAGAFTQSFGSEELDAASLMMPIVGFMPATDPQMRATIDAIATRLTDQHGLVFRYLSHDGLSGSEGTFLLCTFWLAQAYALADEINLARETFRRAASFANDVGLLAEEVDPISRELLGNFPQAFSHIGLINAAWAISEAERRHGRSLAHGAPGVEA
jgi:GH15 family glucan-1,4-alpha-glucosidase